MTAWKKLIAAEGDEELAVGEITFPIPGTYSWTIPDGVTSVSVVCIGAGAGGNGSDVASSFAAGGGGGALSYKNNLSVTPGASITVTVGEGGRSYSKYNAKGTYGDGGDSSFGTDCVAGGGEQGWYSNNPGVGGTVGAGDGGGAGGDGGYENNLGQGGGGGAGGYSGAGGEGGDTTYTGGVAGSAGSGGGGGGSGVGGVALFSLGAGGVGIWGEGTSGSGGSASEYTNNNGGSLGQSGHPTESNANLFNQGQPGLFGAGGGGAAGGTTSRPFVSCNGASGCVRIVWPGDTRQFPSTDVSYNLA